MSKTTKSETLNVTTRTKAVESVRNLSSVTINGATESGDCATVAFVTIRVPVIVPQNRYARMDTATYSTTPAGQSDLITYALEVLKENRDTVTAFVDLKKTDGYNDKQYAAARTVADRASTKGVAKSATLKAFRAFVVHLNEWVAKQE